MKMCAPYNSTIIGRPQMSPSMLLIKPPMVSSMRCPSFCPRRARAHIYFVCACGSVYVPKAANCRAAEHVFIHKCLRPGNAGKAAPVCILPKGPLRPVFRRRAVHATQPKRVFPKRLDVLKKYSTAPRARQEGRRPRGRSRTGQPCLRGLPHIPAAGAGKTPPFRRGPRGLRCVQRACSSLHRDMPQRGARKPLQPQGGACLRRDAPRPFRETRGGPPFRELCPVQAAPPCTMRAAAAVPCT